MRLVVRMAFRDLLRNRWRSGLAIGGMAVATVMLVWNLAFIDGFYDSMVRGATDVEIGHVQLQDHRYVERPATIDYFEWDEELRDTVTAVEGVEAIAPRVRLFGLVGHEDRSYIGRIIGVDPEAEPRVTVMDEGIVEGRWLDPEAGDAFPAEVVIGIGVSRALDVGLGDELVVIAEGADGSMGDGLLEVVGIAETGNSAIDRQGVLLHLQEAQYIAAMEGAVHEAVISVTRPGDSGLIATEIQSALDGMGRDELRARPWQEVEEALYAMLAAGDQTNLVIFIIIFFIVALGILNVLRMSARERAREFGVMLAVGLSRAKLFSLIVLEGALLGIAGALVGGALGAAIAGYHTVVGLDLSPFLEAEATWMGVSFGDRIHFVMTAETVLAPTLGLVGVTILCALWPAIWSVRLEARDAITGRQ